VSNYLIQAARILGEKSTASAEVRCRIVRKCCLISFALLIVPALEACFVCAFHTWPGLWLGTVPWVLSVGVGLLFGLQACSLGDRRAAGLPVAAFLVHFVSLIVLIIRAALALSAP
jgi:hypothetical protein